MASAPEHEDGRELYALLHLSPDAPGEEIRKAYRQFAQIYHPDKYQDQQDTLLFLHRRSRRVSSKPPPHDARWMASAPEHEDGRELYALLHLSPDAPGEEIRKAYRQFAQIYHPDKYQDQQDTLLFLHRRSRRVSSKPPPHDARWMASAPEHEDGRELYALLHLSPDAPGEEIRKAYRQFAQIYHPDKYQDQQMKEVATENFQRIRDAYEILSDENKRQIYDIYGMEGLNSGLELGPKLTKPEEIKEQLERLRRRKEEEKLFTHALPNGSIIANFSVPQYLNGGGIMRGMAMSSEVELPVSKQNTVVVGGNLVVNGSAGSGAASTVLRHQLSPVSSIEFMATAGLRSVIGTQMSRQISPHSTATSGLAVSLRDGSINLSNAWTRQLSDNAVGNIQLVLGDESSISVGWQKKDEKSTANGEVKFGTNFFGASAHYTHRFSSKSHARISGRVGSTALDFEIGGGRRISEFSTVRMMYNIGIQGVSWRFELHRAGQKLIIPVLLSTDLNGLFVTSAFAIPSTLYFLLERYVVKPYYLKREKQKTLEKMEGLSTQLTEARKAAEKAQKLLEPVSNRKKNRQLENDGLVITKALYGSSKKIKESSELNEIHNDMASQVFDVTIPLNFLVTDAGQLKLHDGIKKSGIMGFYDPCPGDPKLLLVEYTFHGRRYKVMVDDYEALLIPHDIHQF